MKDLHQAFADYLAMRRALGFQLARAAELVPQFIAFLGEAGLDTITVDAALAWARQPPGADPSWWGSRLAEVRGFARYVQTIDPRTEVPPAGLLPARSHRAEPYLYSEADIVAVMTAARGIPSPLKAATYETLIGLLAVTGMRVGEAIGLDRDDVVLAEGLVRIRGAKFNKFRELPLHPSTTDALAGYAQRRDKHRPRPATAAFFVSTTGTRLIYKNLQYRFHRLVGEVGLVSTSARCRPRIHDLRHSFAVATLVSWYRQGTHVEANLPQLSTYLGHVSPADTYWYLHAAPELLGLAADRLEASRGARP